MTEAYTPSNPEAGEMKARAGHKIKPLKPIEATSPFGFFLLCIYAGLVLIRPHEWPIFETELPVLRTTLIITFITYFFTLSPKKWNTQATILVLLFFSMVLSEFRAGRFLSDLRFVEEWATSNILPFVLFLGFLVSLKRQRIILVISLIACMVMVHQAYSQVNDLLGEGWATSAIYRGVEEGQMMQVRYVGIFNDPNDMGMFLVMNIPIAIYFFANTKGWFTKMLSLGALAVIFLGIYWTGSRGSLLGALAVLATFFYIRFGKVKSLLLAGISLPGVLVALASFRTIGLQDNSVLDRLTAWYEGVQMVKYRPLFGFGKDRFLEYHPKVAHNSYITVVSELGTIGYMLWMTFVLLLFLMFYRIAKLPDLPGQLGEQIKQEKTFCSYLMVSIIGYCSTALFISRSYIMFFYIFAAIAAASYMRVQKALPQYPLAIRAVDLVKVAFFSGISLIVLYFMVRILLGMR